MEQDAAQKAKFDKLTEEGKKDGAQLLADRADGEDAELRKNLREKQKKEEQIRETRASVSVTNPAIDFARGMRIGFAMDMLYASDATEAQLKMLSSIGVTYTTRQEKEFRTENRAALFARLVQVRNLGAFLPSPCDMLGWYARLFGAGVVDDLWMETVSRHCCSKRDSLPPPMVRFVGLRTHTHCCLHPSFNVNEESKAVHDALERAAAFLPSAFSKWTVTRMTKFKRKKECMDDDISVLMPHIARTRRVSKRVQS